MEQIQANKAASDNPQDSKKAKAAMEEARNMMSESFPTLDNELLHFISAYEKADSFFTLHALVRLSKHVLSAQVIIFTTLARVPENIGIWIVHA